MRIKSGKLRYILLLFEVALTKMYDFLSCAFLFQEKLEAIVTKGVRATLHPDPDSKSSVPDLLPARFASNKEDEEKDSPKKRVFKHGSTEVPNHQKLGKLDTTTEQLDFCLGLTEFVDNYSTTAFTAGSKTFVVRKLKPILKLREMRLCSLNTTLQS